MALNGKTVIFETRTLNSLMNHFTYTYYEPYWHLLYTLSG